MTTDPNISRDPAFPLPPATYVPGLRTRAERHRPGNTGAFSTTEGPAPKPDPAPEDDSLRTFERALDIVKNVLVILTCLAILYSLWNVYSALAQLGDQLGRFVP
jgi:hypothetical protein